MFEKKEKVALRIFDEGGVKFGEFKLKLHEKYPDAPKSPIYISLRRPPDGSLSEETIEEIGILLAEFWARKAINIDYVAGIPKAGEVIAESFMRGLTKINLFPVPDLLHFKKEESASGRRISSLIETNYERGANIKLLIVDDLITEAGTKLEARDEAEKGWLNVTDFLVLLDREQGGAKEISRRGYRFHSVFTLGGLLDFYVSRKKITPKMRQEVLSYRQRHEEYMARQRTKIRG